MQSLLTLENVVEAVRSVEGDAEATVGQQQLVVVVVVGFLAWKR